MVESRHLYPEFLRDSDQYDASASDWRDAFNESLAAISDQGRWEPWVSHDDRDGNPIFSAWSPRRLIAVRVIQFVPELPENDRLEVWYDSTQAPSAPGSPVRELVISTPLSAEHLERARGLFAYWIRSGSQVHDVSDYLVLRDGLALSNEPLRAA